MLFLHRLYLEAPREDEHKRALFEKLVAALAEGDAVMNLSPEHRERVMPRVVVEGMLTALRQQIGQDLPACSCCPAPVQIGTIQGTGRTYGRSG